MFTTSLCCRLLLGCLCMLMVSSLSAQGLEGLWLTYDPRNGKPLSEVELYEQDELYYGRIMKLYQYPKGVPNPLCTACEGEKNGQPWIGLVILERLSLNGYVLEGGTLLIPKYGVDLPCRLIYDPERPDHLHVEAKVGFVKQTSTWERVKEMRAVR